MHVLAGLLLRISRWSWSYSSRCGARRGSLCDAAAVAAAVRRRLSSRLFSGLFWQKGTARGTRRDLTANFSRGTHCTERQFDNATSGPRSIPPVHAAEQQELHTSLTGLGIESNDEVETGASSGCSCDGCDDDAGGSDEPLGSPPSLVRVLLLSAGLSHGRRAVFVSVGSVRSGEKNPSKPFIWDEGGGAARETV